MSSECEKCGEHALACDCSHKIKPVCDKCGEYTLCCCRFESSPVTDCFLNEEAKEMFPMKKKKTKTEKLNELGLIGAIKNECHIRGCRNLETICKDCGRVVCTKTLPTMEWIPVTERLPIHGQKVIFYVKDRYECFCGFFESSVKHSRILNDQKNIFFENLDRWWFEDEVITYWMPLPDIPKD